jgi:serine/threonine protein kinase
MMKHLGTGANTHRLIPEHFIWRVFQALVDGLLTCQTGFCSEQRSTKIVNAGDRLEGWRRILHLDIHPGNVLFGETDSKYPYYKAPVLADFDKAICLDSNPVRRRAQFDEARYDGRNHWQAPENSPLHRNLKEKHRPNQWLLDHATDVYSLGLVVRYMMCCTMDTAEKPWDGLHKAEGTNFYHRARGTIEDNDVEFPWSLYPAVYSSVLIRLVLRCLAFLPQADPSRRKQHRISLFELRDIISTNLDRLDSMYGGAFEGAQSDRTHPLHVLVDEEDARFKVGGIFPVDFDLRVDDFVDSEATTTAREKARPFFRDYQSLAHAAPIPENNSISELPCPSMETMQKAIDETYAAVHQTQVAQAHSSERDTKVLALDHAITTIKKRVNPEGTFKQHIGGKDLKFYSPAQKLFTLASIETCCQERIKSSENELQDKIESIAARDEDIAAMNDEDPAEKEALQSIVDSVRNKLPEMREGIDALKLLCEAANYGRSLLLLGKEADITEHTFDERWSEVLSDAHRGVWDYFWSVPDGVMRAA